MIGLQHSWKRAQVFIRTWRRLALRSKVDAPGSREYRRVLREWDAAGRPLPCKAFIERRAGASRPLVRASGAGKPHGEDWVMPKIDTDAASSDQLWRFIWNALAEYGAVDAWGGKECRRVTNLWKHMGRPLGIAEFILSQADS